MAGLKVLMLILFCPRYRCSVHARCSGEDLVHYQPLLLSSLMYQAYLVVPNAHTPAACSLRSPPAAACTRASLRSALGSLIY